MMNKWIPVSTKLPENEIPVLCWKFGCHPFTASFYKNKWWINQTTYLTKGGVSHWTKLPNPPKEN